MKEKFHTDTAKEELRRLLEYYLRKSSQLIRLGMGGNTDAMRDLHRNLDQTLNKLHSCGSSASTITTLLNLLSNGSGSAISSAVIRDLREDLQLLQLRYNI